MNDHADRIVEKKSHNLKQLHKVFHETYTIDMRSISDINTHIVEIEKNMDIVASNLQASLMDKDLREFFPAKLKKLNSANSKLKAEVLALRKELGEARQVCASYEERTTHVVTTLQQIASNFEQDLIGYVAKVTHDVFSGRTESQIPIVNM